MERGNERIYSVIGARVSPALRILSSFPSIAATSRISRAASSPASTPRTRVAAFVTRDIRAPKRNEHSDSSKCTASDAMLTTSAECDAAAADDDGDDDDDDLDDRDEENEADAAACAVEEGSKDERRSIVSVESR